MLKRLARILGAYLASCCVPHIPLFLFSGDLKFMIGMLHPTTIFVVAVFAAYATFIPATVVITVGEFLSLRRWYYYVLGAGISSQPQVLIAAQDNKPSLEMAGLFFIGGCLSGLVYWALAGKVAGAAESREIQEV
jgi:hypothetical protein